MIEAGMFIASPWIGMHRISTFDSTGRLEQRFSHQHALAAAAFGATGTPSFPVGVDAAPIAQDRPCLHPRFTFPLVLSVRCPVEEEAIVLWFWRPVRIQHANLEIPPLQIHDALLVGLAGQILLGQVHNVWLQLQLQLHHGIFLLYIAAVAFLSQTISDLATDDVLGQELHLGFHHKSHFLILGQRRKDLRASFCRRTNGVRQHIARW
mmetsp:Transcript_34685/g.55458  ORF Transcript_34685/g.55458 Transcript_34685/m.55458 type:complete len:208 (-) Transcript_34685:338-961(-)